MKPSCRPQAPSRYLLTLHPTQKRFTPLLILFLVTITLACRVLNPVSTPTPVPSSAPSSTATIAEVTASSTSTRIQVPATPTLPEATASSTLPAIPLAALFPKLEVINVKNVTRLQVIATLPGRTDVVCFSPDGTKLAVGGAEIWDLTSGQVSLLNGYAGDNLSFSPDGKFLFSSGYQYGALLTYAAVVWDLSSGEKIRVIDADDAAISPDWRVLATLPEMPYDMSSGPYERFLKLTDFRRGIQLGVLKDPGSIMDIDFSPDGSKLTMMLIGGDESAKIIVWDVRSRQMIASLDELLRLDFSADGEFAAGASWRPEMKIFETETWTEIASLSGDKDLNFNSPIFTPDSSMIAGAFSGQIKLFETGTWKELATLSAPDRPNFLAFSPDGRLMASYFGSENKVLLWSVVQ